MFRMARLKTALALLGGILAAPAALAQVSLPEPSKVHAEAAEPLPGLPEPPEEPASLMQPAPAVVGHEMLPGPYFEVDPLLDPPTLPPPGWFFNVEVELAGAKVNNNLSNASIPGNPLANVVHLPSAPLDWTVAPRFELGYRLPSGFGEFLAAFRFLDTDGNGTTQGWDPGAFAALHSRLDLNVVDLDYASWEISLFPDVLNHAWDMQWRIGLRYANAFFDSQAAEPFAAAAAPGASGIVAERNSTSWGGIGPHVGLMLGRHFGCTGWSLVGKGDFFLGLGRIHQDFGDVGTTPAATADFKVSGSQAVPELNLQAGIGWCRPDLTRWSFFAGYEYDYWWNVGRESNSTGPDFSNGSLFDQGFVMRIECHF